MIVSVAPLGFQEQDPLLDERRALPFEKRCKQTQPDRKKTLGEGMEAPLLF